MGYVREALDDILEEENEKEIDVELYDDDWTQEDEEDFNTYDKESITPKQEQFYEEVRDALQSLIDDEYKEDENKELDEEFVSNKELKKHFFRHCLANDKSKVSTRKVVYYDFNNIQEYSKYENELNKNFQSNSDTIILSDPYNIEEVNDAFLQLFKNNIYIIFGWEWNLTNNIGIVQLRVHSFASNVTTNYKANDTLDIIIITPRNKSITLYAIDLSRMKNKIFNILKKYSNLPLIRSQDSNKLLDNLQSKGNNINNYNNSAMSEDLEETSPYTNIKSNGIYSLNTGWVKHPVQQDIPDIDMEEFEKEFKVWEDKYFDLIDQIENSSKEIITEDVGDILENQKESYLISSGNYVLVASIKNKKLTPSWVTSQSITKYNQIRFLSADDAQKFNDKYNLNGYVGKARSSYDLVEINLDPTIKTYINKAWFSKIGSNTLKSAGLQDIKLYSEDILNDLKELFKIFDSKKTKFDLNWIWVQAAKNYSVRIEVKDISQLEKNKNKLIDVQKITLSLKYVLENITLDLYIYINNKDNRLNTVDEVMLSANQTGILISGSEEEIKNETSSIPNIPVIIDIGNFLLKEMSKDINYRSHIQELKELGVKSLENIYEKWDGKGNTFGFENFTFRIDSEKNIWEIESRSDSKYELKLTKIPSKEYYMEFLLGSKDDLYSNNGLRNKGKKAQDELNKEIKNSNLNLVEVLNKISTYWEKEDTNIDRNKVYEDINKYVYDIGQDLLDLAEAINSLEK